MIILDGKKLAQEKEQQFKIIINNFANFRKPKLIVILIGDNFASEIYIKHKQRVCETVGILFELKHFEATISQEELLKQIDILNNDSTVDGIILQLPLPNSFDEEKYLQSILPSKDVDGFHYQNQGKLLQNYGTLIPATPLGVLQLLEHYKIDVLSKHCVVIGISNIVGKPLANLLINKGATVTVCQKTTTDLKKYTLQADILFTATGREMLITEDMVKKDSTVVDIGITRDSKNGKLVGDVDFDNVKNKVKYITPVPGGVGPMTISALIENIIYLYKQHIMN
ncbi:bifunctional 5,10-methylenetetrahydrofolate dehydrogenase/5,10-methenyltetrahydrofolate cyclohydrolase [Spiroplasma endosymbiont of Labia minor]|uniref:bifunctional 5,10-methylenetetrahydrofolate dehydrogenase/5,10-methenyltetrahydrofolate cyclohydrolase n=1 Tax=Spiroplasma endosymbiont of Labia minor TaxID=3066305 RepID=UPI0030D2AA0F